MKTRVLQIINVLSFAAMVTVNVLANILPINNRTTGALSDSYPNLFVPAGLTFAIWGVIYLLLLLFSVYQLKGFVKRRNASVDTIGIYFILSSAANIGWIFAWHYQKVLASLLLMLILLISLITIYIRLGIGRQKVTMLERWLIHLPVSVYLGWITVATIANVTALLVHAGWNGFGLSPVFWTVAVTAAALAITIAMLLTRRDAAYALVVVWALVGIVIKRSGDHPVLMPVMVMTVGAVVLICACIIYVLMRPKAVRRR